MEEAFGCWVAWSELVPETGKEEWPPGHQDTNKTPAAAPWGREMVACVGVSTDSFPVDSVGDCWTLSSGLGLVVVLTLTLTLTLVIPALTTAMLMTPTWTSSPKAR